MKKYLFILVSALVLTGCSNAEEAPETLSVPLNCADTKVLAAFPEKVPNPKYIKTDWEPAEGTDLYAAYNAGGIACSYGIQEAEIGATIIWAPDYEENFLGLEEDWKESGMKEVDLPNFEEDKALLLTEGVEGQGEYHVWKINFRSRGFWIQINSTFFGSVEEAMPIVKAAADSILNSEAAAELGIAGCYLSSSDSGLYIMDITYQGNTTVTAKLAELPITGARSIGMFLGNYENGIVHGIYTYSSEGVESERELYFKRDGDGFLPAVGPVAKNENKIERFQRPLQLKWDENNRYVPGEECQSTLKGLG